MVVVVVGGVLFCLVFVFDWISQLLSGKERKGKELCSGLSPTQESFIFLREFFFVSFPSLQQLVI